MKAHTMKFRDCKSCLVYGTDNRPLANARVERTKDGGIMLFFQTQKLRSIRVKTVVDFYDQVQGVIRSRCELVIQHNIYGTKIKEPWMASCDILEVYDVYQRQKDLRIDVQIRAEFRTDAGWFFSGTIQNISAGGVYIVTKQALKKNDRFLFNYSFGSELVELKAKVLRVAGPVMGNGIGYGCQFVGLAPEAEAAVRKFVYTKQMQKQKE